jgi:hypothetical protein
VERGKRKENYKRRGGRRNQEEKREEEMIKVVPDTNVLVSACPAKEKSTVGDLFALKVGEGSETGI